MKRPPKTQETRAREAEMIRKQLDDLGFPQDALKDLQADMQTFVRDGVGVTRTFRMHELGVAVMLLLSTQAHVTSYARIRKM